MDGLKNENYAEDSTEYDWYLHAPNTMVILSNPY
jgi:hypothetical protein